MGLGSFCARRAWMGRVGALWGARGGRGGFVLHRRITQRTQRHGGTEGERWGGCVGWFAERLRASRGCGRVRACEGVALLLLHRVLPITGRVAP